MLVIGYIEEREDYSLSRATIAPLGTLEQILNFHFLNCLLGAGMCPEKCLFQLIRPQSKNALFARLNTACSFSENASPFPYLETVRSTSNTLGEPPLINVFKI